MCTKSLWGFVYTVGQEINLQCELDAVCVWLSAVLELLEVDLNPQVQN